MTHPVAASKQPLPESITRLVKPLFGGGLTLLILAAIVGLISRSVSLFLHAYLTAFLFCLTISIGALFLVTLQHLCRAGWSAAMRRVMELLMVAIIPLAVMFLPILASLWFSNSGALFDWGNADYVSEMQIAKEKLAILNWKAFTVISLICFAVWGLVANFFWTNSRTQDDTHEVALTAKMQRWSGPALISIALVTTMAAFLWVMSLRPAWFSTMFGVYLFAGSMLAVFATLDVVVFYIQRAGALKEVTVEHWHDLGKFTSGFLLFWAYIAFSQYLLIWYANIPEETVYYQTRETNGWGWIGIALILAHWLIPYLGTMSRHVRRRPGLMCFWGGWILVMHFIDLYWIVMPEVGVKEPLNGLENVAAVVGPFDVMGLLLSLLCLAGMICLYLGVILWRAIDTPLIPVGDPRLPESLAFENI